MVLIFFYCMAAYLIGSIPTGKLVAWLKGVDLQRIGTGNIGASNAYLTLGKGAGFTVLLGDLGKAYIMIDLASPHLSLGATCLVGLFLLLGNMKSIFLRFSGGKGIATSLGFFLAAEPLLCLLLFFFWVCALIFDRYMLICAVIGTVALPFTFYKLHHDLPAFFLSFLICLLLLIRHQENYRWGRSKELIFIKK